MKLSKVAGVIALATTVNMLSANVWASDFLIKRPYVLYYVDGEKTSFSFVKDSSKFNLNEGSHQVVVRFEGAYRDGRETRIVTSEPVVINFYVTDPSVDYTLDFKYPRNYDKANDYVKNPVVTLVKSTGEAVTDAEIFVLPHKPGLQIGRDYLREIAELGKAYKSADPAKNIVTVANANSATVAQQKTFDIDTSNVDPNTLEVATVPVTTSAEVQQLTKASTAANDVANPKLEALKKAYLNADPETQKLFKIWMVTKE